MRQCKISEITAKTTDYLMSFTHSDADLSEAFDRSTDLEVGQLGKSFFTSGMSTFIRPVASVDSVFERINTQVRKY